MTVGSHSSLQARESGSSRHNREISPLHEQQTIVDSRRRYLTSSNHRRDIGRRHHTQIVSPRRNNGRYPQSRESDPKHQSPVGSHSQTTKTHIVSHPRGGSGLPNTSTSIEHSTTGSGGWIEDEDFRYPREDTYPPGYPHSHYNMEQESFHVKQSRAYPMHPHGLSYGSHRSSHEPDDLEQFKMDRYGAEVNACRSVGKQIDLTKNWQESSHTDTCLTEDEDEEDDSDDYGSDSELDLAEEKAHQKLLPKVKELVDKLCGSTKPSLCGDIELSCLVCPTIQHFKGWKALLSHAQHFKKKKTIQHRGYYRALDKQLRIKEEEGQGQEPEGPIAVRASFIDPTVSESHSIVWPPIVVIETTKSKSNWSLNKLKSKEIEVNKKELTTEGMGIKALLSEELQDLHPQDFISCGNNKFVILFEASSVGYMEAKVMNDRLRERKRGREDGLHCIDQRFPSLSRAHNERTTLLFGYLAEPADLKIIDPNKTIVKDWSEESYQEKVQGASKRMKKENEDKQAKLKAMELEVVSLSEKEQNFKMRKQALCHQIETRQKEIEDQQKRTHEMQEWFAKEERTLLKKFEHDIDIMDKISSAKEGELMRQLERDEKLRENETLSRMGQIERRRHALQELKESYAKFEEQKALDREAEAMAKRKNFMAEVRKAETDFNEKIRAVESSLQDQQQGEMIKLVDEIEHEKEAFYKEWLNEQEALKKEAEEVKKQKEQLQKGNEEQSMTPECMVCWDNLTPENRALLDPCGHARLCVDCALEVFKTKRECPLCRQKIMKKPILCPKSLQVAS